jgi:parvulin-like peptidyl-prolyl isomerase
MRSLTKLHLQPEEILDFLRQTIRYKEIYQSILHQKVIEQAAQEREISITPEEVQADADRQRSEKRLEKAADTFAWLADEMITVEDWEVGICDRLLAQKLAKSLFAKEVTKYFAQNRLDFDQVFLYQIIVPYERIAQELFYQIEEEEISFYEAAHLYDIDEKRRHQCGFEGKLDRWSLKPDIAAAVFDAQPGEIVGPLKTEQGYHLFRVEEFIQAELTPERYQEILDQMFQEWLASELNYMLHNVPG